MSSQLLMIEDDARLASMVGEYLGQSGFEVSHAMDGLGGLTRLQELAPDLVILDLMLPKLGGKNVLRRLRERHNGVPVMILTASGSIDEKVECLGAGADDYLVKPFEIRELVARIKVLVRRQTPDKAAEIHCGDLVYDSNTRQFAVAGTTLALPAREHDVLEVLMLKQGKTVSKTALMKGVFSLSEEPSADAIEIYISRLRKKLEHSSAAIMTLRGLGYLLRQKDD